MIFLVFDIHYKIKRLTRTAVTDRAHSLET